MDLTSMLSGSLRQSATGPVDPDEVWERYTQPVWWPRWSPHLREVDYPHDVVEPGTTGRVTGIGGLVAVFRIDAVDHGARTWSWSVRSGPLRLSFDHGVEAAGVGSGHVGGSTAWLLTHALWPVAAGYAPVARLALGRLVSPT
ncbi:MAG TPA: hypothetical protein VES93_10550 [Ornithinibacter sp.]|nr:hypothetical protein [Ornithinibacter sp.]